MTNCNEKASKVKKTAAIADAGATELENARAYTAIATCPQAAAYRVIASAESKTAVGE